MNEAIIGKVKQWIMKADEITMGERCNELFR